jgi:hypothetical protein
MSYSEHPDLQDNHDWHHDGCLVYSPAQQFMPEMWKDN